MATHDASHVRSDWLTVAALSAISISLTVGLHEAGHAVACIASGGDLNEFSALHVDCTPGGVWQARLVAVSGTLVNWAMAFAAWRRLGGHQPGSVGRLFTWMLMLMNGLYAAGYWMFSGIGGVGDWAGAIAGLPFQGMLRAAMAVLGSAAFLGVVWVSLKGLGRFIGGADVSEQVKRAAPLGYIAYAVSLATVLLAAVVNPHGLMGAPALAGILAAAAAQSPLLWMMQWFRASSFPKVEGPPLIVPRKSKIVLGGACAVVVYALLLGRTWYF